MSHGVAETVGQGAMSFLVLRPLHRNVIFALENHINLARWPPLLSVTSSASVMSTKLSIIGQI